MRKQIAFGLAAVLGVAFVGLQDGARVAAQAPVTAPIVFQAAGPNVASIQSMVAVSTTATWPVPSLTAGVKSTGTEAGR